MVHYIDLCKVKIVSEKFFDENEDALISVGDVRRALLMAPVEDVAPRAEVIEEYRKKVYAKMGKYTVFGREYIQRIMREVEKEMNGGEQYAKKP